MTDKVAYVWKFGKSYVAGAGLLAAAAWFYISEGNSSKAIELALLGMSVLGIRHETKPLA